MATAVSIDIDSAASHVWSICTDVEKWPDWTASIQRITPVDGSGIAVGNRFRIKQPRVPELVWEVTKVVPDESWTWQQRSPGGLTLATHELTRLDQDRTRVRLAVEQSGPIGVMVGILMRRLTRRYLDLEARGLKARCETRQ